MRNTCKLKYHLPLPAPFFPRLNFMLSHTTPLLPHCFMQHSWKGMRVGTVTSSHILLLLQHSSSPQAAVLQDKPAPARVLHGRSSFRNSPPWGHTWDCREIPAPPWSAQGLQENPCPGISSTFSSSNSGLLLTPPFVLCPF